MLEALETVVESEAGRNETMGGGTDQQRGDSGGFRGGALGAEAPPFQSPLALNGSDELPLMFINELNVSVLKVELEVIIIRK